MSNILLSSANEFLKKKQSSLSESLSSKFNIPRTSQYSTEPKEKPAELSFFGKPFKLSEYKTLDEATKPILEKVSDIPFVRDVLTNITQRTSGTGISAMIKAASPDITFKQAYEVAKESQAKNDDTIQEKFLTQLVDATPQTLIGVALGFVPIAGIPLSVAYWSAISAGSQIEEKGEITSLTNIGIDVLGDRMLGEALSGLLKQPANTLFRTIKKTFATEGGTEVAQDILKYANDYGSAKTDKEKNKILNEVKEYFTSGQILITAGVGGVVGGGISAGGYIIQQTPEIKNQQIEQLQREGYTYDEAKERVERGGFASLPEKESIQKAKEEVNKYIPKELEPLAKEARKYKSAEEFIKAQTLYRGQPEGFKFRRAISDVDASNNILIGKGVFTTTDKKIAETYGKNILEFKKPTEKVLDISNASINDLKKLGVDENTIKLYQDTLKNISPATIFGQTVEFDGKIYKVFRKVNIKGETMYELQPIKYGEKIINKSIDEIEKIVKPKQNLSNIKDAEDILMNDIIERFTGGKSVEELLAGGSSEAGKLKAAKEQASKWLNKQGYDFVRHQGGIRAGGGNELHDVYIALSDEALKPQNKSQLIEIWNKANEGIKEVKSETTKTEKTIESRNLPAVIRGETFTLGERRTLTPSTDKIKLEHKIQVKATEKEQRLAKIAEQKAQKLEEKNRKIRENTLNNINKYKGKTSVIIENLKKKYLSDEDINNIVLENGVKLVDTIKVKRNSDKSLASVITKEDIEYIKNNYKGEKPSIGFENVNKISEAMDVLEEIAKKYELSAVWFERKGLGKLYDKNIDGQRAAQLQKTKFLKRFEKAGLFKKGGWFTANGFNISKVESEHIAKYYIARQNRGYTTKLEDLSPKERTFVEIFDEIIKETEPMFYDVANKVGKKPRKVENYAPIMTSQDIKMVEETGAMDWLFRKHPAFFSLKERTEKAPKDIYETDYRKVVSAWLDGMTQFLNTAEETQDIKYLIESDEFKSIVNARDYGVISKWLQDITTMKKISGVEKTTILLRKTTAKASLGLSYASVVKQALTQVVVSIIEKAPPKLKSEYAEAFNVDVSEMPSITKRSGDVAISDLQEGISRIFTGALTEFDRANAQASLNALLDKEYSKYKNDGIEVTPEIQKIIEKKAQDKLDLWYGGFFKGQKPEMFRTPVGNFFNMFIYPLTSQLNGFYQHILKANGVKQNVKNVAEVMTAATIIAYLEVAITNLSFNWDDEEDMAKDVLLSLVGNIPIVSQIAYGLSMDTDIQISAGIGGIQNLLTKISAYYQGEKELKDVFFATGELAGLPKQVRRFYEGMEILQNGGVIDSEGNMMVQVKETDEIVRSFLRGKYGSIASRDWITNKGKKKEERRWFVPEVEFLQNGDYERKAELYISFDKEKRKELKSFLSENQVKKLNKAIEDFIEKEKTMEKIRQKIMEKGLYSKDKVDEIAKKVYEDITSE